MRHVLEKHPTIQIKMSRETDETVPLYDRPKMGNEWGADCLVSIHTNAANDPKANGVETYHSEIGEWGGKFEPRAKWLAICVQRSLVKVTKLHDRGFKTRLVTTSGSPIQGMDYYAVLRRANCPAIIVEVGFHTNPIEENLLKNSDFRQRAAEAIAEGLLEHLRYEGYGVKCNDNKEVSPMLFADVPDNHWGVNAIKWASGQGLLTANKEGQFRPNDPITRAEMAAILHRMAGKGMLKQ